MGKYTDSVTLSFPFDGDSVTVVLGRITFADALAIRDNPENSSQIVRKYVTKLAGLHDVDGASIPLERVFSEFYFSPLVLEITKAVLATGSMPEEQAQGFGER